MALPSTIRLVELEISDVDRGVYHSESLRLAQHPSETAEWFVTRVLAYALQYSEDLAFGRGLDEPDAPPLAVDDPTGRRLKWIDLGTPTADRIHRASKQVDDVVIVSHRPLEQVLTELSRRAIHRAEHLQIMALPPSVIDPVAERLARKNRWAVLRTEDVLYLTCGEETFEGAILDRSGPE